MDKLKNVFKGKELFLIIGVIVIGVSALWLSSLSIKPIKRENVTVSELSTQSTTSDETSNQETTTEEEPTTENIVETHESTTTENKVEQQPKVVESKNIVQNHSENQNKENNQVIEKQKEVVKQQEVVKQRTDERPMETTRKETVRETTTKQETTTNTTTQQTTTRNVSKIIHQSTSRAEQLEFLRYLNELRASLGLSQVKLDNSLNYGAEVRASELSTIGHIQVNGAKHVRLDGSKFWTVLPNRQIGECLTGTTAKDFTSTAPSNAKGTFERWKNSPGHYALMIEPELKSIGYAAARNLTGKSLYLNYIAVLITGYDY